MKERPILFTGPMVRAILDGRKSQTRRVVKPQPTEAYVGNGNWLWKGRVLVYGVPDPSWRKECVAAETALLCPYGQPGDRLWVRETFFCNHCDYPKDTPETRDELYYRANPEDQRTHDCEEESLEGCWTPSIHMPRWVSRITLEITGVRVERVQSISEGDALAEGVMGFAPEDTYAPAPEAAAALWDHINGKTHPWASNPWVWVIEFRRVK